MGRQSLPKDHPCAFAKDFLADHFVGHGIEIFDKLTEQKNKLVAEGKYSEAWQATLQLRAIQQELAQHCEKLKAEQK